MNLNPATVLDPVFHFLDEAIADYGVYLYLALVWLSLIVIAWIFSGGFWRKPRQRQRALDFSIIVIQSNAKPPPLPPVISPEPAPDSDDDQSFAA